MEKNLITEAERFLHTRHKDKRRVRFLRILAVAVVFVTIYALILPAITMSNEVECGMVEHVHTEACWQEQLTPPQPQLTCPFQGTGTMVLHTHDSFCYNQQGELICTLEERAAHTHGAECYREHRELICTQVPDPGHTHTAACYAQDRGGELVCGQEESGQGHTHTQECYPLERMDEPQCGQEETEDVVDEATGVVTVPGHRHTAQCWEKRVDRKLVCGQEESEDVVDEATGEVLVPGHHHSAECWLTGDELCYQYGCGQHESQGHTHSDSCYDWTPRLICQEEERPAGHVHTDECYEITQLFVCLEPEIVPHTHEASCYDENGALVCQLPEVTAHQHTAECFTTPEGEAEPVRTLICGMEEHQHDERCYVQVEEKEGPTFYCGLEEHVHTMQDCFFETGTLRCTLTEHVHDLTCLEPPVEVSEDPEQSQDPAESEEPEPSESQEPEQAVVEGVELVDAQFPNVYSTDEFTMSFYVNGFAQVAEEHSQDQSQSQEQEPLRLPDPMPTHSGEEFMELVENMVPLAAMPRMMAYAAPMSSGIEEVDPPAMGQTGSMTAPGSGTEPDGTAVDNSSQVILNDPALPEDHTEGGQQAPESLPASVEPTPEAGLPSAEPTPEPTPEADTSSAQPERVLLNPSQVRFVVEPLEDEQALNDVEATVTDISEEQQAQVVQLFTVSAYVGERKLDTSTWNVTAEVAFTEQFLSAVEGAGEDQISVIDEETAEETGGDAPAAEADAYIAVVDLDDNMKVVSATVEDVRTTGTNTISFPVKMSRSASRMGVALVANPLPKYKVEYYAYLNRPVAASEDDIKATSYTLWGKDRYYVKPLSFIDTSGGKLPKNSVSPTLKYLSLKDLETGGEVKTEQRLTEIYREVELQYTPRQEMSLQTHGTNYLNRVEFKTDGVDPEVTVEPNDSNYWLKEIWVQPPELADTDQWDIYAEKGEASIEEGKTHTTDDGTVVTCRKVYSIDSLAGMRYTNSETAEDDPNAIWLRDDLKIRMVYDVTSGNQDYNASFFDYNVSAGIKTDGSTDTGTVTKQGINSDSNYASGKEDEGKLGFGNATWTGLYNVTWSGNEINKANEVNKTDIQDGYLVGAGGATFGIVKEMDGQGNLVYSGEIRAPELFQEEEGTQKTIGKTSYSGEGNSLSFSRKGDTYTLTSATANNATTGGLNEFNHPVTGKNKYYHIWTNNFWPLDESGTAGTKGNDPKMGEAGKVGTGKDANGTQVTLQASDDGKAHNAYFGMRSVIGFELDEDYVGPLEYYFYGDDDLWVFLDGRRLICDLGGVHTALGEYVNLWDYLRNEDGTNKAGPHTLTVFYTERGASGSTCWMQFTLPKTTAPPINWNPKNNPVSLRVEKRVEGNLEVDLERKYTFNIKLDSTDVNYPAVKYDANDNEIPWSDSEDNGTILGQEQVTTVTLKHGEYIVINQLSPYVTYEITEVFNTGGGEPPEDCSVSYQTGMVGDLGKPAAGTTTGPDRALTEGQNYVLFTNSYVYELPETGGPGVWYTMAVVPLMAAGCLWYKKKSQGEGAADGS